MNKEKRIKQVAETALNSAIVISFLPQLHPLSGGFGINEKLLRMLLQQL